MKNFLFYIFLIFYGTLFSQENIILNGVVEADSIEGTLINIVNLTQEKGTTNFTDGTFKIDVKENDTLIFSSVQ